MSFTDKVLEIGNHVKFAVNTKGTGTRGNPLPDISKTEMAPATENPRTLTTTGTSTRVLRDLGKRRKVTTKI